jgi:hypothetical protein
MKPCRSTLSLVTILALALGAAAFGCGPQKKFCPEIPNGVCPTPMDSAVPDDMMDAGSEDRGPVIIGSDAT